MMLDKDKQIEEMARIICKASSNKGECEKCSFYPHRSCYNFEEAHALYNAGYRKEKQGEWKFNGISWTCSECGEYAIRGFIQAVKTDYCPHCGAKMKGE